MDLLAQLVAIDSVNPALVPGAAGEREIAAFVADWLGSRGLDVRTIGPEDRLWSDFASDDASAV